MIGRSSLRREWPTRLKWPPRSWRRKDSQLVIDPVALLTIHALGVADEVVKTAGRLGVTQSTIDLITETMLKHSAIHRRGFTTFTKTAAGFVGREVSRQQVEAHVLSLEGLINWIDTNCDIVTWSPALASKREDRKELADMIGEESLDSILAAIHPGRRLYSDDLRLRRLAKEEFNVDGVATQPILMRSRDRGLIDSDRYCKAIVQLANAGYVRIRVDRHVLLEAARQADWDSVSPFVNTAMSLGGDASDEDRNIHEVVGFLRLLWEQSILPRSVGNLVLCVLDALALGRNHRQVAGKVLAEVFERFRLIPSELVNLRRVVAEWHAMRLV